MHFLVGLIFVVLVTWPATATEAPWVSLKSKAGISLSYRYNPKLEVKAKAFYQAPPESFLLLLQDTASVRRWLKQSQDARLLDGSSKNHWRVYTRFQSTWPVSPRDMVSCADVQQLNDLSLQIRISDCASLVAEQQDYMRIRDVKAQWTLTSKKSGFELEYQGSADPGGNLPAWLVKQLTLSSLHASFVAFKTELKRPAYQPHTTQATH
jgi:hypothetical protein